MKIYKNFRFFYFLFYCLNNAVTLVHPITEDYNDIRCPELYLQSLKKTKLHYNKQFLCWKLGAKSIYSIKNMGYMTQIQTYLLFINLTEVAMFLTEFLSVVWNVKISLKI